MSKKTKLAFAAAVMLMVVTGSNMMQANAWTKFEKLRIAPIHKNAYAKPAVTTSLSSMPRLKVAACGDCLGHSGQPLAGTLSSIQ